MKIEKFFTSNLIDEKTIEYLLSLIKILEDYKSNINILSFQIKHNTLLANTSVEKDAFDILNRIGVSVKRNNENLDFLSDYDFIKILKNLCHEKLIDDYKSYQYYGTRENLAQKLIDLAEFKTNKELCLEPSAGQGGIAKYIPSQNLHCVEYSRLNADILKEKGFIVFNDDFINFSKETKNKYDRVIMSPPFLSGKCIQHVINAYYLLNPDGIIVSILPPRMKNKVLIENVVHNYSDIMDGDFDNTNTDFVILKLKK